MYIKIKKPKHWVTPNKWKIFDFIEKRIGEDKTDKITDVAQSIVNWTWNYPRGAHKESKPKIRIDPWDTWSMDCTLSPIIEPMLKQLKVTKHGSPYIDDEDVPYELKATNAPSLTQKEIDQGYPDNNHHKRWEWILDEMIWAFEQNNTDWERQFYSGKNDRVFNLINPEETDKEKKLYTWEKGPNHTFKVDREGMNIHRKRMQNGFRLFGKYFTSLWD